MTTPVKVLTPLLEGLVLRAHHTAVCVEDFEKARAFFTDVIGMRVEGDTFISPRKLRQASTKALSCCTLAIACGSILFSCASG